MACYSCNGSIGLHGNYPGIAIATMSAAPIVTNVATSASYIENATGIVIAPAATVSDLDSSTLVAATVRISAGSFAGAGDRLGVNLAVINGTVSGTNIHVSYNAANGTLLL